MIIICIVSSLSRDCDCVHELERDVFMVSAQILN